jgi:hypothetical protein
VPRLMAVSLTEAQTEITRIAWRHLDKPAGTRTQENTEEGGMRVR